MSKLSHVIKLSLFLFAVWLLLSGHYTPLLLGLGVLSSLLVVLLAVRVDLVDRQVVTVLFKPRSLLYLLWLGREIIKSNIDVTLRILDPKLRISPNVIRVKATQRSELGRVTYANSITLVPGTVAMSVEADEIIVHAITRAVAADLQSGEMDRRITELEGGF
jgi:multicomponent Na+:H+ antiporter subunit E